MRWFMILVVGAVSSLLTLVAPLGAQRTTSASFVKAKAAATKIDADGKQVVTVTLTIDDKWEIFANPIGMEELEGLQTILMVRAKAGLTNVRIDYPVSIPINVPDFGEYHVYRKSAVIKAYVERASGDTSPLQIAISFQATGGNTCKLPSTVQFEVP